jgi:hypothetical protein
MRLRLSWNACSAELGSLLVALALGSFGRSSITR